MRHDGIISNKKNGLSPCIKMIATEIYQELTQMENITEWQPYYIIGLIFAHEWIGIKEHLQTEDEFMNKKQQRDPNDPYGNETYLSYLSSRIKGYIDD